MRYPVLLAGLVLWTGCKGEAVKTFEQVVEEIHHLDSAGNLRVTNVDGTVRLYGGDESEVRVKATKRAYSNERLRALEMRISSRPDSLSIETIFPPRKKWSLRDRSGVVDYVIIVPESLKTLDVELINGEISIDGLRGGSAHARLVNGRLSARDSFANLDYQTQSGAIDFYYDWWETGNYTVKAAIANGAIGVLLPRRASFHLEAETSGGSIMGNLVAGDERSREHRKKITTKIGSGTGPTFRLKSVNGNIRVNGY